MAESGKNKTFDQLLLLTQNSLTKTETARQEVINNTRKVVKDRFEHIQDLRQKLKIENEKQKLLIRVLEKMKESREAEKLQTEIEEKELEFMKKQVEILSNHLSLKKDQLAVKKVLLSEKNSTFQELQEKLSMFPESSPTEKVEILTVHPKPFKPELKSKQVLKDLKLKKQSAKGEPDDFFSELLSK